MLIDVWSDLVCPWCYIGKRRLERALAAFEHRDDVEIVHRSFQLHPDMAPGETLPRREMLKDKYGLSDDKVATMDERMEQLAAQDGLDYDLSGGLTGSTLDAHRLVHYAQTLTLQDAAVERLFRAYFTEQRSLFERASLVELGQEVGLDPEELRRVLEGDRYRDEVIADHTEASTLGARGVPFFLLDGRYALSGAQPVDAFEEALKRAWTATRAIVLLAVVLVLPGCGRARQEAPATPGLRTEVVDGVTQYTNRLISEKSPYLQLHAHNPVDWYPWGPEAFERARREDKAIFLSIGYSTCHWCHVMEEESFSNPAIAEVMNKYFISIKVDREERPDVDRVYLAYVTSVNGGGWPMSLFLTPDLKPFFGATYLPPDTRGRDEGFKPILERVATEWRDHRDTLLQAAAEGSTTVSSWAQIPRPVDDVARGGQVFEETFASISRSFDEVNGGFGGSPKFPRPVVLTFLMRYHARTGNQRALDMTIATLRGMARGGIRDQLGGGFHRYTVDAAWRVPHFEKMLYDQAQLAVAYTDAYQLTKDPAFASIARETLTYVLRNLRDPSGGFYSAEDADSLISATDRRLGEGAFYLWTMAEVEGALGRDAALVAWHFDLSDQGNLATSPTPDASAELAGKNALVGNHTVAETARQFKRSERDVQAVLDRARQALLDARATRPRPAKDDKIIAGWNGMMISAFARAGQVFDDPQYISAAVASATLVEARLFDPTTGALERRYRDGQADVDGLLEDYAFLVQGLLDLYEASFDPKWLGLASRLQATQDAYFWDEKDGAYFSTRADAAHLLARMKEDYDGAEPAANSVSAMNLLRLWQLLEKDAWRVRADATFRALSGRAARSGAAVPQLIAALDFRESTPKQIVIAGEAGATDTTALLRLVHERFIPNKVLALVDDGPKKAELVKLVPFLEGMTRRNGRATIYVCENYVCRLPTSDLVTAARLLDTRPVTKTN